MRSRPNGDHVLTVKQKTDGVKNSYLLAVDRGGRAFRGGQGWGDKGGVRVRDKGGVRVRDRDKGGFRDKGGSHPCPPLNPRPPLSTARR